MEPARKFRIIVNSKECGTCSGATPSAVAKKVVKKLCGTSSKVVRFSLKECKRGCERECGPYQGRMEKLDKPYKRNGKKITHRVVCGKVRKMRGGRELVAKDFEKKDDTKMFSEENIDEKPHIFFGGEFYYHLTNSPFKYVIFNKERFKFGLKKSIGISVLEENIKGNIVKPIENLENLNLELQYELSRLNYLLKTNEGYKTIRGFLTEYNIFKNIEYSTNDESFIETNKFSILYYSIAHSLYNKYVLVFNDPEFIIINRNDYNIISIEKIFSDYNTYTYIYKLEKDDNVPKFIKKKLNELISQEKEIKEQIIEEFRTNTNINFDELYKILQKKFSISNNVFNRIFDSSVSFIKEQIKKSRNAHMKNNSKKTVNNVYKKNNKKNIYKDYDLFFEKGKILANEEKAEKAERNARRKAERNAEEAQLKAKRNAEEAQRNAERKAEEAQLKAKRNAEEAQRKAERNEEEEETEFMNSISSKSNIQFNKQKYKKNEKYISMVKNFIEEYYDKDNDFLSKLLMWYCNTLLEIYRILSDSFVRKRIIEKEFNVKLKEYLTAEKLYESESFPKNIDILNYNNQYEELKAFANFFIDTLNSSVKESYVNLYNLIITRKDPSKLGSKILFMNLKNYIRSALEKLGIDYIEELKIPVSTVNNNRKQQQQQPEPTGNNNNNNGNGN